MDEENKQNPGYALAMNCQPRNMVTLKCGLDFVTKMITKDESMYAVVDLDDALNKLREKKEGDIGGPFLMVDCDYVISVAMTVRFNYFQTQYRKIFNVMDLEDNDSINFERFLLLLRNINRSSFTFQKARNLWKSTFDLINEEKGQEFLSFRYFSIIADRNKLFGHQETNEFFKSFIDKNITNFEELESEWALKKKYIKLKLLKGNRYTVFLQKLIEIVEEYVYSTKKDKGMTEIAWLRYRILDEEASTGYMDSIVDSFIPEKCLIISAVAKFYV
jgi:hypothetical protein